MANSVYKINKGINQSIEFRGLKAQYIWWLGGGIVALLIVFAIIYIIGVPTYICLVIVLGTGSLLVFKIYGMSHKYGEHGLMKSLARRQVPKVVRSRNRKPFLIKKSNNS